MLRLPTKSGYYWDKESQEPIPEGSPSLATCYVGSRG